jgi:hypothetical protein
MISKSAISNIMGIARTAASCLNAGVLELTACSSYIDHFISGAAEASDMASDIFDGIALCIAALIVVADIYHFVQKGFFHRNSRNINFLVFLQDLLSFSTALVGFAAPKALPFLLIAYQTINIINLISIHNKYFTKEKQIKLLRLQTAAFLARSQIASSIAILAGALLTSLTKTADFGAAILGLGILGLVITAITKKTLKYQQPQATKSQ